MVRPGALTMDDQIGLNGRAWTEHLMPTLRGHSCLWHRCSLDALRGIVADGAIRPNEAARFASKGVAAGAPLCVAHQLGAVPLFDFDSASLDRVYWAAGRDWAGFLHDQGNPTIWLRIPRTASLGGSLIEQCEGNAHLPLGARKILYVEAWHVGPIPWSQVDHVYASRRATTATLVPVDREQGVAEALELGALWDREDEAVRVQHLSKPGAIDAGAAYGARQSSLKGERQ